MSNQNDIQPDVITKAPLAIVMLTLNEEHNIKDVIDSLRDWVQEIYVVDSLSTDRTVEVAMDAGATVVQRPFTNFGNQWNWALNNLPIKSSWTMKLDPDERISSLLRDEIVTLLRGEASHDVYELPRRLWFMGGPMRQHQYVTRLWRTGTCRFSEVLVNEHPLTDSPLGQIHHRLEHLDSPNLHHWFDKQNVYTTMRAIEMARGQGFAVPPKFFGSALERRMFFKKLFFCLPARLWLHFIYLYFVRGAILDGTRGLAWARLRTDVYRWAEHKTTEMRLTGRISAIPQPRAGAFNAVVMDNPLQQQLMQKTDYPPPVADVKRLRLAINAVSLSPGGGLVVLIGLLKAWAYLDASLDITVYASRKAVVDAVVALGHHNIRCVTFAEECSSAKHFLQQQTRLGPVIERGGADVVMSTNSLVGRCQLPQLIHHQNLKRFMMTGFFRQLSRGGLSEAVKDYAAHTAMKRASVNVFISTYLRETAEVMFPDKPYNNHVVFNGIDDETLGQPVYTQPLSHEGLYHLISLQSPAVHKDNPTLIRSFARLIELAPDKPWTLTAAGEGMKEACLTLARELGVADRITFPGYLSHQQLDPIFCRSLCLIFTSYLEGFGNPPLESMARGCPAVACRATAIPEVIGDAGILVDPGDAEGFAQAVLKLSTDPTMRQDLVQRGFERAKLFRWSVSAQKIEKLLRVAAASSRS